MTVVACWERKLLGGARAMTIEHVWNMMAHAQKPDLVFQRNGRVHLNRRGRQFSRLLAAEVCASVVVMLDTPCSEVECKTTGYPLHLHVSPSLPLPCVTVCRQVSTELYLLTFCLSLQVCESVCAVLHTFPPLLSFWQHYLMPIGLNFWRLMSTIVVVPHH